MAKFQTLDLMQLHEPVSETAWEDSTLKGLALLPDGDQRFWGIPFKLGTDASGGPSLIELGQNGSVSETAIPVSADASHIVFAHVCDSRATTSSAGQTADYATPVVTAPGEHLADYVVVYEDGSTHVAHVRRRFEVNQVYTRMQSGFACRPHQDLVPLPMRGPYPENMWGRYQTIASVGPAGQPASPRQDLEAKMFPAASWSIYALENPHPDRQIKELLIKPTGAATVGIGGITLFTGCAHPLRHERLQTFRLELGAGIDPEAALNSANIDLGVIARRYTCTGASTRPSGLRTR